MVLYKFCPRCCSLDVIKEINSNDYGCRNCGYVGQINEDSIDKINEMRAKVKSGSFSNSQRSTSSFKESRESKESFHNPLISRLPPQPQHSPVSKPQQEFRERREKENFHNPLISRSPPQTSFSSQFAQSSASNSQETQEVQNVQPQKEQQKDTTDISKRFTSSQPQKDNFHNPLISRSSTQAPKSFYKPDPNSPPGVEGKDFEIINRAPPKTNEDLKENSQVAQKSKTVDQYSTSLPFSKSYRPSKTRSHFGSSDSSAPLPVTGLRPKDKRSLKERLREKGAGKDWDII